METKFNFNSAICTSLSQSERLLALGVKPETADMSWIFSYHWECYVGNPEELYTPDEDGCDDVYIPAWSLHRLIEMMPKCVRAHSSEDNSPSLHPYVPKFDYLGVTIENIDEILVEFYQHTDLFDNIIDCIEWLIKEGYFNEEYLNKEE